jgi:PAS domain S-box-containing protein
MRVVLAALAATAIVSAVLGAVLEHSGDAFSTVSWTAAGAVAALGLLRARGRARGGDRRAWDYLLAASVAWLLGQVAWDVYAVGGSPGSPNVADIGWLGFPILAAAGTYRLVPMAAHARTVARLEAVPLLVAVGAIVWALLHHDFVSSSLGMPAKITAVAYAIFYLALPIVMVQALIGGSVRLRGNRDLLLVLAGLATEALAFVLWASQLLAQTYVTGQGMLDLLWTLGMLMLGAGGVMHREPVRQHGAPRLAGLLPGVMFLVVLAALAHAAVAGMGTGVRLILQFALLTIGATLMMRSVVLAREQRRLLADQEAAHAALREARATSARFFELSRDLLCTIGHDGRIVDSNPAWRSTLGYTAEDLAGVSALDLTHPDDRDRTAAHISALARGTASQDEFQARLRAKHGAHRWISWSSLADTRTGMIYGRGADVTEVKRIDSERQLAAASLRAAHRDLERKAAELSRSNAELEQFAYTASHDLAEPLRSISGFSQFLLADHSKQLDDEGREFLGYIVDGAARMRALIDALLEYSRVGRERPAFKPVRTDDLVEGVVAALHAAIRESGASIDSGPLPVVDADPRELARVFQNLIANAIKFRGSESPAIRVSAEPVGDGWCFSVADNGIGVEPQYAERVFGMFKRLHGREVYPGTGIGLTIARRIVERHHGRIWVESAPAGGSVFKFTVEPDLEAAQL